MKRILIACALAAVIAVPSLVRAEPEPIIWPASISPVTGDAHLAGAPYIIHTNTDTQGLYNFLTLPPSLTLDTLTIGPFTIIGPNRMTILGGAHNPNLVGHIALMYNVATGDLLEAQPLTTGGVFRFYYFSTGGHAYQGQALKVVIDGGGVPLGLGLQGDIGGD